MDASQSMERRVGIARYALEAGWILDARLIAFLQQGRGREYLAASPIDGVLSMVTTHDLRLKDVITGLSVPVVDLWHDFPEYDWPRVLLDQHAIGRAGADHLLDRGLTNLLFYSHEVDRRVAAPRCAGFFKAAADRGRKARELWWGGDMPTDEGEHRLDWLGRMLVEAGLPIGVMAVNDQVATEVIEAATSLDLKMPEDVAVVGVDNDPIHTRLGAVPISSVDSARELLGYQAAALLDRMFNGEPRPEAAILVPPAGVVMRHSTNVIAVDDKNVRSAAQFIRDHFREPITVADVAASSYLSRRRLQDLFQAEVGHGMNEEIVRQRLAAARRMLIETGQKIDQIARQTGFGDGGRMSKVFRRELQMTPQQYRHSYQSGLSRPQ